MDNWQAFVPGTGGSSEQLSPLTVPAGPDGLEPAPAGTAEPPPGLVPSVPALTGQEERARTLSLIDFLADYDARRNPPVYDLKRYDLFLVRDADVPAVPGVSLSPAAEAWLTVDFLDLPPRPEVPGRTGRAPG